MSAVLLVRLKITDLTAWTACEAGRRMLPEGHRLDRVAREQLYLFEPEGGATASSFEELLEDAVNRSNFFVNPNKEAWRFLGAAARGERWRAPEGAWGIVSRSRGDTRDEGLRERLQREHPLQGLGAIRRAKVWWLWTRGPDGGLAVPPCHRALGPVRSASEGLLVNPHAESSQVIEGEVLWNQVEAFLRAPDAPLAAAA